MSKCNLFQELSNVNGTFLMFQNYSTDLTKQLANPEGHRVVPSHYMLVEIPSGIAVENTNYDKSAYSTEEGTSTSEYTNGVKKTVSLANDTIPIVLQNYYENSVSVLSEELGVNGGLSGYFDNDDMAADELAKELFWKTLCRSGIIGDITPHEKEDEEETFDYYYFPNIKYIGDINLSSTSDIDGSANNEIYIYVPEDAAETRYEVKRISKEYKSFVCEENFLHGWKPSTYPANATLVGNSPMFDALKDGETGYFVGGNAFGEICMDDNDNDFFFKNKAHIVEKKEDNSFYFNAIVVFYDIYYNTGEEMRVKCHDVPMGIYILGTVDRSNKLSAGIKKFTTNNDIYGQGTAYGLRLCEKFLSLPNVNMETNSYTATQDELDDYTSVMRAFGDTQVILNKLLSEHQNCRTELKQFLANWRNYRTNVPYIRQVGGVDHWFVNGRDLGPTINN